MGKQSDLHLPIEKKKTILKGNFYISEGQITSSKNNWVIKKITFYLAYFTFMKLSHTLQKRRTRCLHWLKQETVCWADMGDDSCLKSQHLGGWGRKLAKNSRPAWATKWDPVFKMNKEKGFFFFWLTTGWNLQLFRELSHPEGLTVIGTYIYKVSDESGFILNLMLPLKPSIKELAGRKGKGPKNLMFNQPGICLEERMTTKKKSTKLVI